MADSCSEEDDLIDEVLTYLERKRYPDGCSSTHKRVIRKKASKFSVCNGVLFYKKKKKGKVAKLRFIRNDKEKLSILKSCHVDPTGGHFGIKKTVGKVSERFSWSGIVNDVKKLVSACDICQKVNPKLTSKTPELHPVPVKAPWFHIGIDFIGPITPASIQGNSYILTLSDYFSKFVEAVPLPDKAAFGVVESLHKIFMRMGIPRLLTSDNGKEFKNQLDEGLARKFGIKRIFTTPYHPQGNGLDERFNQTLQNMVVKMIKDKKDSWESYIDSCIYAYNTAVHESSLYTPFELMFGRKAVLPIDIEMDSQDQSSLISEFDQKSDSQAIESIMLKRMEDLKAAKENIEKAQLKQKKYYDRKHAKPEAFDVGEKVLVKDFHKKKKAGGKLFARFTGPYEILGKANRGVYRLGNVSDNSEKQVTGSHIKPYIEPQKDSENESGRSDVSDDGENESARSDVSDDGENESGRSNVSDDGDNMDVYDHDVGDNRAANVHSSEEDDSEAFEEATKDNMITGNDVLKMVASLRQLGLTGLVDKFTQLISIMRSGKMECISYKDFCASSCKKRSIWRSESYQIECVTTAQIEAVSDYMLSNLCEKGCNIQFISYTLDILLPEGLIQVIMNLFGIKREEAQIVLYSEPPVVNIEKSDDESTEPELNDELYEQLKAKYAAKRQCSQPSINQHAYNFYEKCRKLQASSKKKLTGLP